VDDPAETLIDPTPPEALPVLTSILPDAPDGRSLVEVATWIDPEECIFDPDPPSMATAPPFEPSEDPADTLISPPEADFESPALTTI